MVSYEGKVKIRSVEYVIIWDEEDKISIPTELTAALTSEEMLQLIIALRSIKFWMDDEDKKRIVMSRND